MVQTIDVNNYVILAEKETHFKELVSMFANRLSAFSDVEKDKLALFKAIELTNAIVQIKEQKNAANRLGKEKAAASFKIVRAAIRERQIVLSQQDCVSLKEPRLKKIIDEACSLFHAGKKDSEQWEIAMALSTAQYIVLNQYLPRRLQQFHQSFQDLYPTEIIEEVTEKFIKPYQKIVKS